MTLSSTAKSIIKGNKELRLALIANNGNVSRVTMHNWLNDNSENNPLLLAKNIHTIIEYTGLTQEQIINQTVNV